MKNKLIYSLIIVVTIFFSVNICSYTVHGASTIDDVISGAQSFIEEGTENTIKEIELKETSNFIFNAFLACAIVIAVIIGMVIGIQFMTSGVDEKAKIKEALLPYALGCFVVFGAFGIWKLAVTVLSNL